MPSSLSRPAPPQRPGAAAQPRAVPGGDAALDKPVTVPVLSVQGELDPVQPAQAYARDTHHVAGNLRQVTIHRSGHFPQEETPAGFVRARAAPSWPTSPRPPPA